MMIEKQITPTCYDCECCDIRDDDGSVWCFRFQKAVDLDDRACEKFVEE